MAGDWIPIRRDLDRCREVGIMVEQTGKNVSEVIGELVRFWSWVDGESDDGVLPGATEKTLEITLGLCPQFVRSLSAVKWIQIREDGILIPNFDHWFGQSAKRRLTDAKRKRALRQTTERVSASAKCPQIVRKMSKKVGTTGQDRTGQNRTEEESARAEPSSRHALEVCRRYAEGQQGIRNPAAYATVIHRSGQVDNLIDQWLTGTNGGSANAQEPRDWRKFYHGELSMLLRDIDESDDRRPIVETALDAVEGEWGLFVLERELLRDSGFEIP